MALCCNRILHPERVSYHSRCLKIRFQLTTSSIMQWPHFCRCPYFANEIGGEVESLQLSGSNIACSSQTPSVSVQLLLTENSPHSVTNSPTTAQMLLVNNKGVSVMEQSGIDDDKRLNAVGFIQEYLDSGALFYRKHFYEQGECVLSVICFCYIPSWFSIVLCLRYQSTTSTLCLSRR